MEKTTGNGREVIPGKANETTVKPSQAKVTKPSATFYQLANSERVKYSLQDDKLVITVDLKHLLANQLYLSSSENSVNLTYGSGSLDEIDLGMNDVRLNVNLFTKDEKLMAKAIVKPKTEKTAKQKKEPGKLPDWLL